MHSVTKSFGQAVRKRRIKLGLTQEELAELAEMDRSYLSDIERGTQALRLTIADKIAKALNTSLSALFKDIK